MAAPLSWASTWKYKAKPVPGGGGSTYVNFDFGMWSGATTDKWVHATYCAPAMKAKIGNLSYYSMLLLDFDKQVFCVSWEDWQYGKFAT